MSICHVRATTELAIELLKTFIYSFISTPPKLTETLISLAAPKNKISEVSQKRLNIMIES